MPVTRKIREPIKDKATRNKPTFDVLRSGSETRKIVEFLKQFDNVNDRLIFMRQLKGKFRNILLFAMHNSPLLATRVSLAIENGFGPKIQFGMDRGFVGEMMLAVNKGENYITDAYAIIKYSKDRTDVLAKLKKANII